MERKSMMDEHGISARQKHYLSCRAAGRSAHVADIQSTKETVTNSARSVQGLQHNLVSVRLQGTAKIMQQVVTSENTKLGLELASEAAAVTDENCRSSD